MKFNTEIFSQYDKKWALLTAGKPEDFNTMTISWGGLGTLWNKPAATVYVRKSRYTHVFMESEDYFTISFFSETCKPILGVLGSKSGRDIDKIHDSGLTPMAAGESVAFIEAEATLICRKLFVQELEMDRIPKDIRTAFYSDGDAHDMYIGEVVDVRFAAQD
ncbi:MAG: flavin reductase [Eubacterium sp.]|nr:flavin reductase [Eubacterium sp.]